MVGHLCNVPDIHWRSLDKKDTDLGNPSHYLDPENYGYTASTLPTDFQALKKQHEKEDPSFHEKLGSLWWRADQLARSAIEEGKKATAAPLPERTEEQKKDHPYNKSVHEMVVAMGVLGHFVGDATMPFHNTVDYDGYAAGHGGVHSYYEDACVDALDLKFPAEIFESARREKISSGSFVDRMKLLSVAAASEIPALLKADKLLKPSKFSEAKGNPVKERAERPGAEVGAKAFKNLIVKQTGRSAAHLAAFWDEIYEKSGKPNLKAYKTYNYPFAPDFIKPDYL
jgi:hypothetical protein